MKGKVRAVFGFLLVLCFVTGYSLQASCAELNVQPSRTLVYRPVAVEKVADIVQLEALVGNYTKALKNDSISYISAVVSVIKFAVSGEKAQIYVWGRITKKATEDGVLHSHSSEYSWTYEAEKDHKNWVLRKSTPNAVIPDRAASGSPRSIFVNYSEYVLGDWVYFANPKDEDKLYKITMAGNESTKVLDESVSIMDLAFARTLVYVNKSRANELWMIDTRKFVPKKAVMEFSDRDGSYFTDGFSIFRAGENGRLFQRLYSRVPFDRARLTLTDVKERWVYFFFFSDGEKLFYRVKTDGTATEFLSDVRADWRDED